MNELFHYHFLKTIIFAQSLQVVQRWQNGALMTIQGGSEIYHYSQNARAETVVLPALQGKGKAGRKGRAHYIFPLVTFSSR